MSLQHIEVKTRAVHFRLLVILHLRGYVRTSRQRSTIIVVRKLVIHRFHFLSLIAPISQTLRSFALAINIFYMYQPHLTSEIDPID